MEIVAIGGHHHDAHDTLVGEGIAWPGCGGVPEGKEVPPACKRGQRAVDGAHVFHSTCGMEGKRLKWLVQSFAQEQSLQSQGETRHDGRERGNALAS